MPTPSSTDAGFFQLTPTVGGFYSGDGENGLDSLLGIYKWGAFAPPGSAIALSWSFAVTSRTTDPSLYTFPYPEADAGNFISIDAAMQDAVRQALPVWANYANITFTEVVTETAANVGELRFGVTAQDPGSAAFTKTLADDSDGSFPSHDAQSGDVWLGTVVESFGLAAGQHGFNSILHEIGHALGLSHSAEGPVQLAQVAGTGLDYRNYTIMSYDSTPDGLPGTANLNQSVYPETPMYLDVKAIQYLYGANTSYHATDDTYSWNPGETHIMTIWDGGGTDTIDASNQLEKTGLDVISGITGVVINLNPGQWNEIGATYQRGGNTHETQTIMIADGAEIENATGSAFRDSITGNDLANLLKGGAGDDTLVGGGGADTALYDGNRESFTVTRNGNTVTVFDTGGGEGSDTLTGARFAQFGDGTRRLDNIESDFDGNGQGDFLWRNGTSGDVAIWFMNGGTKTAATTVQDVPLYWDISGGGDFDGDGQTDIVWHNTLNENIAIWLMDGAVKQTAETLQAVPPEWEISGVEDFDGDTKADILWYNNSTADVAIWLMDGTTKASATTIQAVPAGWNIEGTGDFDGDAKGDILWRNAGSGEVAIWLMNGTTKVSAPSVQVAPLDWSVSGVGDFDGNGKSDILWQSTAGEVAIWFMDGGTKQSASSIQYAPLDWTIKGTPDTDWDGKSDILWQRDNGEVAVWLMDGATKLNAPLVQTAPSDWALQMPGTALA